MSLVKKYYAEFIGTFILVFIGCGTAMLVGCDSSMGSGYLLTALAFGLAIVVIAYGVGNISGGHVNPAVSLAVLISGGMTVKEFFSYVCAQVLGAICGAGALNLIFSTGDVTDMTSPNGKLDGFGCNGLGGVNDSIAAGFIVEIILTCLFVMTILGVTSKKQNHGSFGGLVIGLTLAVIHIIGIGLTGTSVNPARSFGPALMAAVSGNSEPIKVIYVFILAPLVGAAIGAFIYKYLESGTGVQITRDSE